MQKYDREFREIRPNYSGSRFHETYDGHIVTDRMRREIADSVTAKYNEWRNPKSYR